MDKKLAKIVALLTVTVLLAAPTLVQAFNPATHIYIAERVFEGCGDKIDLFYGSTAPDLAFSVANPGKWPTAKRDTHYRFKNLRRFAIGPTHKAFANGWLTHNERWGADFYAHIFDPTHPGLYGYVVNRAKFLHSSYDIDVDFCHYAIEVAIDLLLKGADPKLADKLIIANLLRSWQDRNLMVRVLVWKYNRTDWFTLAAAELTFRDLVGRYAWALSLPYPWDRIALVQLGMQLAQELYGIDASFGEVWQILGAAIDLCDDDYGYVINHAIGKIKDVLD